MDKITQCYFYQILSINDIKFDPKLTPYPCRTKVAVLPIPVNPASKNVLQNAKK